ncbi:hypothetical protein QVD17_25456 [Tagetes erecta]|uniref:O-fucosyltransferase family protein n=1 Tax=Tagetes erecta TaxID=13708 RepID=A0AAD8NV42_TARER|nr:hypothetical protein QVD17_25456 [Tagetes erecta]
MAKTRSIKNKSILQINPHLHPQFLLLCSHKTSSSTCIIFISLIIFLTSLVFFTSINLYLNTHSLSIITHTSRNSPHFIASISSLFQYPSSDNDDEDTSNSPVNLSVASTVPLPPRFTIGNSSQFWKQPDGEGYKPCLAFGLKYRTRSVGIVNEKKRFLVVVVNGGLVQIRNQIVDAVVVARVLEAALVLPVLKGDESEFSEIFDVEHFRKTLKADIRVVSSLPSTRLASSWQSLENQIPYNVHPFWIRARFFKKLNEQGSLVLTGLDSKLSNNLSPDLQKLKCKVAFHALKFAKPVRELGDRIARRMWIEGPYVAIHLNLEKDLWVNTNCPNSNTNCPLNVSEAARLLKESGAPANARVYVAGGEPFGDEGAILPLKKQFVNVVTKHMLARDVELSPYRNRTAILTAIDYIVSLSSDVFLPTYNGHLARALQGHRAYVGHRKYVSRSMSFKGQPQARGKRRDRDVTVFPVPECMCKH